MRRQEVLVAREDHLVSFINGSVGVGSITRNTHRATVETEKTSRLLFEGRCEVASKADNEGFSIAVSDHLIEAVNPLGPFPRHEYIKQISLHEGLFHIVHGHIVSRLYTGDHKAFVEGLRINKTHEYSLAAQLTPFEDNAMMGGLGMLPVDFSENGNTLLSYVYPDRLLNCQRHFLGKTRRRRK